MSADSPGRSQDHDVAAAVAEILQREGVAVLIGCPVNSIIEAAADIRTVSVRQERVGLHMADAIRRAIAQTEEGVPALLEFITAKETTYSFFA